MFCTFFSSDCFYFFHYIDVQQWTNYAFICYLTGIIGQYCIEVTRIALSKFCLTCTKLALEYWLVMVIRFSKSQTSLIFSVHVHSLQCFLPYSVRTNIMRMIIKTTELIFLIFTCKSSKNKQLCVNLYNSYHHQLLKNDCFHSTEL